MRWLSRREPPEAVAQVQTWGPEPIGSDTVHALAAANGRTIAGVSGPTPPGWGERGALESTDSRLWASPQAFNGDALSAHVALAPGGGSPVIYDAEADYDLVAVAVPDQIPPAS